MARIRTDSFNQTAICYPQSTAHNGLVPLPFPYPNPLGMELLSQLATQGAVIYNLAGKQLGTNKLNQPGIYLIKEKESKTFQKIVIK